MGGYPEAAEQRAMTMREVIMRAIAGGEIGAELADAAEGYIKGLRCRRGAHAGAGWVRARPPFNPVVAVARADRGRPRYVTRRACGAARMP